MGGFGSGRKPDPARIKVEDCLCLDVNKLLRQGCLETGWYGLYQWVLDDGQRPQITIHRVSGSMILDYRTVMGKGLSRNVCSYVSIGSIPCSFGGSRPFFCCPGLSSCCPCNRRITKLYLRNGEFRCRYCHGLHYRSQSEDRIDRSRRRADGVRRRLICREGSYSLFPSKPKGMWRRTYSRLIGRLIDEHRLVDELIDNRVGHLLACPRQTDLAARR